MCDVWQTGRAQKAGPEGRLRCSQFQCWNTNLSRLCEGQMSLEGWHFAVQGSKSLVECVRMRLIISASSSTVLLLHIPTLLQWKSLNSLIPTQSSAHGPNNQRPWTVLLPQQQEAVSKNPEESPALAWPHSPQHLCLLFWGYFVCWSLAWCHCLVSHRKLKPCQLGAASGGYLQPSVLDWSLLTRLLTCQPCKSQAFAFPFEPLR